MTLARALVIACLLVAPGVTLRAGPHLDRLVGTEAPRSAESRMRVEAAPATISVRLSERPPLWLALGLAAEALVHIALLVVVMRSPVVAGVRQSLPLAFQLPAVALLAATMAGFFAGTANTFPFVAWRMYAGEHDGVPTAYSLTGTGVDGERVELDLDLLVPPLGPHRLHRVLEVLVESEPRRQDLLDQTLLGLASTFNGRNREAPIRRLELYATHLPVHGDDGALGDRSEVAAVELE